MKTKITHDASAVPVPRDISLVTGSVTKTGLLPSQFTVRIVQKLSTEEKPMELRRLLASKIDMQSVCWLSPFELRLPTDSADETREIVGVENPAHV